MRLVGGSSYSEGVVEVYYNGRWGSVCYYGWDEHDANIVCKQLGFTSGELVNFGTRQSTDILLDNVMCSSNDTILASCSHYGVGIKVQCNYYSRYTYYYTVAGVKCHGMCFDSHTNTTNFYVCILGAEILQQIMPVKSLLLDTNVSVIQTVDMTKCVSLVQCH